MYESSLQDKVRPPAPLERGVNADRGVARLWVRDQREEAGTWASLQEAWGGVQHTQVGEFSLFLWLILSHYFYFHHLYCQLLYFQRPGQQVNTYWWQLASSSRPACWCILIYLYRNDILLCTIYIIFCTLSQFSCSRKDCLSLPCPTFPMQAPSFLILPLGVNWLAASLQKRFKISASLCLSFVALSSYHSQLSTY